MYGPALWGFWRLGLGRGELGLILTTTAPAACILSVMLCFGHSVMLLRGILTFAWVLRTRGGEIQDTGLHLGVQWALCPLKVRPGCIQ